MPHAVVVAPLALAAVLVLGAVAKLADRTEATLSVMRMLRLPALLARPGVATALPWVELLLGGLLILAPRGAGMWVAGLGALALTCAYSVVVVRAMGFRPRPSCGCFGRIGDQRITARTVWRNTLLVALAVVTVGVAAGGHSTVSLLGSAGPASRGEVWSWLLAVVVVAALTTLVVGTGDRRDDDTVPAADSSSVTDARPATATTVGGAPSGSPVPRSSDDAAAEEPGYERRPVPVANLTDPAGTQRTLAEMASERAQLLVFVSCYCPSSGTALAAVPRWQERLPVLDVRFVSSVPVQPLTGPNGQLRTDTTWGDHGAVTWHAFGFSGRRPVGVLLGTDGLLAGGPVSGVEAIEELVTDIAEAISGR